MSSLFRRNQYIYCINNPVIYVDPSGHWPEGSGDWFYDLSSFVVGMTQADGESISWGILSSKSFDSRMERESNVIYFYGKSAGYTLTKVGSTIEFMLAKTGEGIGGIGIFAPEPLTTGAGVLVVAGSCAVEAHAVSTLMFAEFQDGKNDNVIEKLKKATQMDYSSWNKGNKKSSEESLRKHFEKHVDEVNAKDMNQYLRKAEAFKMNLKKAKTHNVDGYVEGVIRYIKNGKYIDLAPDGSIISFGSR